MEKREGYKKTKIGWMPDDWETKTLGTIGEFLKGKGIAKKDLIEDGVPCVRYGEIYTVHHWVLKKFYSFISSETASQSTQIQQGDILFAGSGETVEEIGKAVAYLHEDEAYAGGDTIILRPGKAHSAFLSACLDIETSNMQKRKLGQGNSVVHIYPAGLKKLMVPFPPLPEQKKIASILTTVDDKISSIEHQIQQTEQLKKGLMEKLLTEGIGHTEFKETKIGRIPKGWSVVKIGDIFKERKESSKNLKKYPLHSLTIESGLIGKTDRYERSFLLKNKDENLYRLVYPNDLLFNPMNLRFGAITISKIKSIVSVSAYYNILKLSRKDCDISYYDYLLASQKMINIYERFSLGSLVEKKRVHLSMFIHFTVPIPPLAEQKQIATILSTADDKIEVLTQKKTHYQTLKKGLSQQLLTGQMRVKI